MQKILIVLALCISSNIVFAQPAAKMDQLETCKYQLEFLKSIADEKCRMVPDDIYNGTGRVLNLLNSGECRIASDSVVQKAQTCLRLAF